MGKKTINSEPKMRKPVGELHHYLLGWYDLAKRSMPWRETRDPYAIWLSETMLQQTQVETVKPYYHKFLQAFPTVADLAAADLQEVLKLWAGLGYYRRARHLHLAAQRMVELHDGRVPETLELLLSLPGIGRYTAGAVGSIAFGLAVPVVDGNVMRVLSRLTGFDGDIADPKNAAFFWKVAGEVLSGAADDHAPPLAAGSPPRAAAKREEIEPRYGDINQAMMELGATVCTPPPSRPACLLCPVQAFCRAYAEGRQMELPVKRKKGAVPVVRGVALVVVRRGKLEDGSWKEEVLVMQRPRGVVWEEMWEFPVVEEGGNAELGMRNAEGEEQGGGKYYNNSRHELRLDTSIKNGHGLKKKGMEGRGREDEKHETRNADGEEDRGGEGLARWVEGMLGVAVTRVVACGEVVHTLTHRRMEFRVVKGEVVGEGIEALRHKGTKGGGKNAKLETRNSKLKEDGVILPVGVGMGGERYVAWRWVRWPLGERSEVPMGRVVGKVAETATIKR
jgi:adenine-specific DNA glycosylase